MLTVGDVHITLRGTPSQNIPSDYIAKRKQLRSADAYEFRGERLLQIVTYGDVLTAKFGYDAGRSDDFFDLTQYGV